MPRQTYQIGRRRRRNWRRIILVVLGLLVIALGFYIYKQFQADTKPVIRNSAGSTHPLDIPNSKTQHFDQGVFAFDAPADWKLIKHDTAPYNLYSYHSTLTNADNRYLDIYIDSLPQTLAVNKAVAVRGQGGNLSHGLVSENCTTFTSGGQSGAGLQNSATAKPLSVSAKWDGVEFLCDNDNTTRNVVGTSSPESINKVVLTGATTGQHAFFFVYTDNNVTPDYSMFYDMLDSFVIQ